MILIGMFDSPFVRRVAVSLHVLGFAFEHRNWSVGRDFERIRAYNPLGRVPTLVLDDGAVLTESAAILDDLDAQVGASRALLPAHGPARRQALQLMALATSAADKGVAQLYEGAFRPPEKRHEPWVARCRSQMHAGLDALEQKLEQMLVARDTPWLLGTQLTQADITVGVVGTFLHESLQLDAAHRPVLARFAQQCEALPAFRACHQPFFVPQAAG
jgi:glutathione S-transferase